MLLEDLNEDCLREIFKYLSPTDLANLYILNKRFLEIPSQTKVFEDLCENLSIINKDILAENSVQLHDFGKNIGKTALFRFIDNLQCRSNMAEILDRLGLKNEPHHKINDVEILTEILELKDSTTSWCSFQRAYAEYFDFIWKEGIGKIVLFGGDDSATSDYYAGNSYRPFSLNEWLWSPGDSFEPCCDDLTQRYFQNIFKNWLFAENVPNSIIKSFKRKSYLSPTYVGPEIYGKYNIEKLLYHISMILEDLKTVLRENDINENCLRFTESPHEYVERICWTIYSLMYNVRSYRYYDPVIDKLRIKMNRYLNKKVPSVNVEGIFKPVIITKFVEEHYYKSDVEYFGILWRLGNGSSYLLLLARDDLVLFTLA